MIRIKEGMQNDKLELSWPGEVILIPGQSHLEGYNQQTNSQIYSKNQLKQSKI